MGDDTARRVRVEALAAEIARLAAHAPPTRIMHVCGSHEHSLCRWGLRSLLPESVELIGGPGCPVCVCPESDILAALSLAERGVKVLTYGDMLRVPTRRGSLAEAAAHGAPIDLVYSPADAVRIALAEPDREVVFFAVGFETTAAPTAALVAAGLPPNLTILCSHRLTPSAMELLLGSGEIAIDALIAPGHVSVVIGVEAWRSLVDRYHLPCVVAGFGPDDVLAAVANILAQRADGRVELHNTYSSVVAQDGNPRALALLDQVFEVAAVDWRGLGRLAGTGLLLRAALVEVDARARHRLVAEPAENVMPAGCGCAQVMLGQITPPECPLYESVCSPSDPYGPCMVSAEGTCYIWKQFGGVAV